MTNGAGFRLIALLPALLALSGCLGQAFEVVGGARYDVRDLDQGDANEGQAVVSRKLDFHSFEITAKGNWYSLPDTIKDYAFLRAAELTLLNSDCCFEIASNVDTTTSTGGGYIAGTQAHYKPWIRMQQDGSYARGTSYVPAMADRPLPTYHWYGRKLVVKTVTAYEVQWRQKYKPQALKGVLDAEDVYRTLAKKTLGNPTALIHLYGRAAVERGATVKRAYELGIDNAAWALMANQNRQQATQSYLDYSRIAQEDGDTAQAQLALDWALLYDRDGVVSDVLRRRGVDPVAHLAKVRERLRDPRYAYLLKP